MWDGPCAWEHFVGGYRSDQTSGPLAPPSGRRTANLGKEFSCEHGSPLTDWLRPSAAPPPYRRPCWRVFMTHAPTPAPARELVDYLRHSGAAIRLYLTRYQTMLHAGSRRGIAPGISPAFAGAVCQPPVADLFYRQRHPDSGFSEWLRILGHRLLPARADTHRLNDCLRLIYPPPTTGAG